MKKINWFVVVGMMLLSACFVACTDDDGGNDSWDGDSAVVDAHDYDFWTYFDFETGTTKTLNVKSQEGGITGIYKGDLALSVMGASAGEQNNVKLIISTVAEDTVLLSLDSLTISMDEDVVDPYSLAAKAVITKEGDKWVLTGVPTDVDVTNNGEITVYSKVTFSGKISEDAKGETSITVTFKPGDMPMSITGTYTVTERDNKVYMLDGDESSFDWDIAFHKYDVKTNGGSVVKLNTTDLASVSLSTVEGQSFTTDVNKSVMVDMSNMMQGFVGYMDTKVNEVLTGYLTATPTGSMPPYTYELNSNVFVVKMADGQYAKMRFTDYTNAKNQAVYATFDYEFPLK